MHNQLSIMGNLTRDPEMRYAGETAICKFGIALNNRYRKGNGEEVDEAHFFDCVCFGRTAEVINEHFHKGKQILLTGSLSYSSWEDRETGGKRSKVEIKVFSFSFTGQRSDSDGGGGGGGGGYSGGGRRDDRQSSSRDSRGGGRDSRGGGRDDHSQHRDSSGDGRDTPSGGGNDSGGGGGYDFDDIPF